MNKINLEQILLIPGFTAEFTTPKEITNNEILTFFKDMTKILKEFDEEINNVGKTYLNLQSKIFWPSKYIFKIQSLDKTLQVKDQKVKRNYNIIYRRNPRKTPEDILEITKDNMYQHVLLVNPNIEVTSNVLGPDGFLERLMDLPYIEKSTNYSGYKNRPLKNVHLEKPPKFLNNPEIK